MSIDDADDVEAASRDCARALGLVFHPPDRPSITGRRRSSSGGGGGGPSNPGQGGAQAARKGSGSGSSGQRLEAVPDGDQLGPCQCPDGPGTGADSLGSAGETPSVDWQSLSRSTDGSASLSGWLSDEDIDADLLLLPSAASGEHSHAAALTSAPDLAGAGSAIQAAAGDSGGSGGAKRRGRPLKTGPLSWQRLAERERQQRKYLRTKEQTSTRALSLQIESAGAELEARRAVRTPPHYA